MAQHVDGFLRHLRDAGLAPTTIRAYGSLLERLAHWCDRNGIRAIGSVRAPEIQRYLCSLRRSGPSDREHRIAVSRLRKYFGFLEREGHIFASPMVSVRTRRSVEPSYPTVPRKDLDSAFRLLAGGTDFEIRARAILELAYSSALRPRELYSLRISDIDFRGGLLAIRQSKGKKDRVVPIGATAMGWIGRYLKEVRPRYVKDDSEDVVFLSHRTGKALGVKGLWWALQEALRRRGLPLIKPYSLRVAAATDLLREGMNLVAISRLLGHAKLETTQGYLRVEMVDLSQELRRKHPRHALETRLKGEQRS